MNLKELFEAISGGKHVTFCFGRMNPPTIGHEQVFKTMSEQGGDYKIFVSQSQDKKDNPLDYQTKIKFIKAIHSSYADHVVEDASLNTVVKVASYLYNLGYRDATFVAGSDRLPAMSKLLKDYNGIEGKSHGFYKFDVLDFVSSGDREDGAEGVAGVSASGARAAAANNDFESFKKSTGAGQYAELMYNAVRKGLGIKEDAAGVGIITKQNSTKDVGPGTIRKNLKAFNLVGEEKEMKAKEFIPASKPRNFVAKNQQTAGAGAHKDKKKAEKQGDIKHKK
jgi:hypothetical protein